MQKSCGADKNNGQITVITELCYMHKLTRSLYFEAAMPGSQYGLSPAPYGVVVERKSGSKLRAQRKAFSRTAVVALSLIGIAALCHKYTYRGYYQDLADAPAKADDTMDAVAVKAIEGDMKKEEKKVETGFKENWVRPPPHTQKFIVVWPARRRGRSREVDTVATRGGGGGSASLQVSIEPSHACDIALSGGDAATARSCVFRLSLAVFLESACPSPACLPMSLSRRPAALSKGFE